MRTLGLALLGLGNVGSGVVRLLSEHASAIERRLGAIFVVRGVLVRDVSAERQVAVEESLLTCDADALLHRADVDIVIELIGGVDRAYDLVSTAIRAGKCVVTANKALIAERGEELFAAASRAGVDLFYEAAVCGGVPVLRSLREGLASDKVESIVGIVNGTSNFVCSRLAAGDGDFAEVVRQAQLAGYAEADPTLDISGMDSAQKLCILAMLCFGVFVSPTSIHVEGIGGLAPVDFRYAEAHGYTIKPLALASEQEGQLALRVHPAMIPNGWLLADVPDSMNAVYVRSRALGSSMYYGAGAGMMPTAVAVVSDVIDVSRNLLLNISRPQASGAVALATPKLLPMEETVGQFYLRLRLKDQPGSLGRLATLLGAHHVSMAALEQGKAQPGRESDAFVMVALQTHRCKEGQMQSAYTELVKMTSLAADVSLIRILGEPGS